eukprot:scaffold30771_cov112-Isochrysis_galbana.AAC.2
MSAGRSNTPQLPTLGLCFLASVAANGDHAPPIPLVPGASDALERAAASSSSIVAAMSGGGEAGDDGAAGGGGGGGNAGVMDGAAGGEGAAGGRPFTPSSAIDSSMILEVPTLPRWRNRAIVSCIAFSRASLGPTLLMFFICRSLNSPPMPCREPSRSALRPPGACITTAATRGLMTKWLGSAWRAVRPPVPPPHKPLILTSDVTARAACMPARPCTKALGRFASLSLSFFFDDRDLVDWSCGVLRAPVD